MANLKYKGDSCPKCNGSDICCDDAVEYGEQYEFPLPDGVLERTFSCNECPCIWVETLSITAARLIDEDSGETIMDLDLDLEGGD